MPYSTIYMKFSTQKAKKTREITPEGFCGTLYSEKTSEPPSINQGA